MSEISYDPTPRAHALTFTINEPKTLHFKKLSCPDYNNQAERTKGSFCTGLNPCACIYDDEERWAI